MNSASSEMSYRDAIREAMADSLEDDATTVLLGEDVADAGGVFKTSVGLVERFGRDRVFDTPICENGFVGVALGLAVTGYRPIVEIMFSDFLPSAGDAIVNELPKFRFMSGGQCNVPVTVRAIGGATGRFGTQHSATGETWYSGLPGLKVATAGTPQAAYSVLRTAIAQPDPVLFFEHKGLYGVKGPVVRSAPMDVGTAEVLRPGNDVTIVASLLMVQRALRAAAELELAGVDAEVIDLQWVRPMDMTTILDSVRKTRHLITVEEQVQLGSWGSSVIAQAAMEGIALDAPPDAVTLPDDLLIPYSPTLEDAIIPSATQIAERVCAIVGVAARG